MPRPIFLQVYRTEVEVDDHVVGDEAKNVRCWLSTYVRRRRYWGVVKRSLIRKVVDCGGGEVESSILNAVASAGSEALPAPAILRAVTEPILVSHLRKCVCQSR